MLSFRLVRSVLAFAVAGLIGSTASSSAGDWSKIRIGTEGAYAPFNYFDSAGQLRGLDIDIVQALCARMGAMCEFIAMQQEGLVLALQDDRVDAVATGWSTTEKRKKIMDFTDRYVRGAKPWAHGCNMAGLAPDKVKRSAALGEFTRLQRGHLPGLLPLLRLMLRKLCNSS